MADGSDETRWFLADLVIEIRIEGERQNVVHVNTVLVRADSAEDAYVKALDLGALETLDYVNPDGKVVAISFRGLGELFVVHGELEHGAELLYSEKIGLAEDEVARLVAVKDSLGVFRDREPSTGPNYMPREIRDQLVDMLGRDSVNEQLGRGDRP